MEASTPAYARLLDGDRPRPSLSDAVAAGGGLVVAVGVGFLAAEVGVEDDGGFNGIPGAVMFFVLALVAFVLTGFVSRPAQAACTAVITVSIFTGFGLLIFPKVDSFADIRLFLVLTIAGWLVFYFAPTTQGRPIFIALAALLFYFWILAEVVDAENAFSAAPIPSPAYAPGELFDAIGGGGGRAPALPGARVDQVTLDDLDSSDPLYPVAQDCADGDDDACQELYNESDIGSDFEEFAQDCGGRERSADFGVCADFSFDEDDFENFEPDFDDDEFTDEFTDPLVFGSGTDDKAAEIGIVSLLFAVGYLGLVRVLHTRGAARLGTAFVLPGTVALVTACEGLGDASGTAVVGGLITMLAGLVLGVIGFSGDRRFSTWTGGALASLGALIIAVDATTDSNDEAGDGDLFVPGLVVIVFGLAVVALALLIANWLKELPPRASGAGPAVNSGGWPPPDAPGAGFPSTPAPPTVPTPAWPPTEPTPPTTWSPAPAPADEPPPSGLPPD
ncbi:MAG: hypothetical protein ACT4OX_13985 [Actinomycetota bacterium]